MASTTDPKEPNRLPFDQGKNFFATRSAAKCCSHFLPRLESNFDILDVGSGPGSITLDLAQLVSQGHVTGFDISSENTQYATELAASRGVTNVNFIQGDARNLSAYLPDTKFDVVHAHMVMMHLPDPVTVLQQMRALLKPGGFLTIRDAVHTFTYPPSHGPDSHQEAMRSLSRQQGAHPDGGVRSHSWVHEAGFAWENIEHGAGAWDIAQDNKKFFAQSVLDTAGIIAKGLPSDRDPGEVVEEWKLWWSRWRDNEDSRYVCLDGWVIARL